MKDKDKFEIDLDAKNDFGCMWWVLLILGLVLISNLTDIIHAFKS